MQQTTDSITIRANGQPVTIDPTSPLIGVPRQERPAFAAGQPVRFRGAHRFVVHHSTVVAVRGNAWEGYSYELATIPSSWTAEYLSTAEEQPDPATIWPADLETERLAAWDTYCASADPATRNAACDTYLRLSGARGALLGEGT